MAPWSRLRPDRSSDKEKKRTSTANRPPSRPQSRSQSRPQSRPQSQLPPEEPPPPLEEPPPLPPVVGDGQSSSTPTPRRNHRTRDSVVSLSAVNDSPSQLREGGTPARVPLLDVPEASTGTVRPQRFSLLRFRHASDSQLSKTAQEQASPPPPVPAPPSIITTAPTSENSEPQKRRSTFSLARHSRVLTRQKSHSDMQDERDNQTTPVPPASSKTSFEPDTRLRLTPSHPQPPPYGDETNSTLALPASRVSESSRSDASSGDRSHVYAQTTTTHTVSTTTTFFRLPRRKKNKGPLFPLPPKTSSNLSSMTNTPHLSSARTSESPVRQSLTENGHTGQQSPIQAAMRRADSRASGTSQSSLGRPPVLDQRGRSSTLSSLRKKIGHDDDSMPTPPLPISTRTSTSTTGRPSLGALFNVNRVKQHDAMVARGLRNGEPGTPISLDSKQNSFNLPREPAIVIPERQEGDTPAKYLARLEEVVNQGALVAILSKSEDDFMKNVLRSYMRRFKFFEDPLDMAIRKMLMHVELPKETQQIDRTLQSFADRYHECNPGIFASSDDAYFVAFSILILHTDVYNKNNKHKMTKQDYVKNAHSQGGICPEVLECFYDNICYTTFIHLEDDGHIHAERAPTPRPNKKGPLKTGATPKRDKTGPVDPYTLILENHLEILRPPLDDVLDPEDSFSFLAPHTVLNISELNKSFFRSGVIQILSARSRPEAFANQATISNPSDASVGVVDIKVTKVGVLWRKDQKKKKTRSPWQEWGAVLTGSQLYFFRNTSWVKNLMHQYENYYKGRAQGPVVFKPPLEHFKPDFLVSLDDAVALVDSRYRKHKNAFYFSRQDTYGEVLLADNEVEYRDWLAKINYAAAFRSSGVRMRGTLGQESRKSHDDNARATSSASNGSTMQSEDQSRPSTRPEETPEEQQIIAARRQILAQKIHEAEARVRGIEKVIEGQLRNGRHLKLLTPIQQRSRQDVTIAAEHAADALRTTQIAKWRTHCYHRMLALDLEDDVEGQKGNDQSVEGDSKDMTLQTTRDSDKSRLPFGRLGSKNSGSTTNSKQRPGTQPNNQKLFSMDEIFRTPSRLRAQGSRPKTAWELPPINFDRRKSTSQTRASKDEDKDAEEQVVDDTEGESLKTASLVRDSHRRTSSELGPNLEVIDKEEREILVQSGVDPERIGLSPEREDKKKTEGEEGAKLGGLDDKEARSKARHSFQRKLHSPHVPTHQRSKKGKDSASTIVGTDESASTAETEGLARAPGSFTVHGKKASVVTFGSEWQNISPEERLRLKRPPHDTDRPEDIDSGDADSGRTDGNDMRSPVSAMSDIVGAPSFKSARSSLENGRPSLSEDDLSPTAAAPVRVIVEKEEGDVDEEERTLEPKDDEERGKGEAGGEPDAGEAEARGPTAETWKGKEKEEKLLTSERELDSQQT